MREKSEIRINYWNKNNNIKTNVLNNRLNEWCLPADKKTNISNKKANFFPFMTNEFKLNFKWRLVVNNWIYLVCLVFYIWFLQNSNKFCCQSRDKSERIPGYIECILNECRPDLWANHKLQQIYWSIKWKFWNIVQYLHSSSTKFTLKTTHSVWLAVWCNANLLWDFHKIYIFTRLLHSFGWKLLKIIRYKWREVHSIAYSCWTQILGITVFKVNN